MVRSRSCEHWGAADHHIIDHIISAAQISAGISMPPPAAAELAELFAEAGGAAGGRCRVRPAAGCR